MNEQSSREDPTLKETPLNCGYVANVSTLTPKARLVRSLPIDFAQIDREGYQLVRGFGIDTAWFETELCRVSGGKLFFSDRVTIPRQSRGHSGCEPLKAAVRGR